jgi:hypothetical protein
MNDLRVVKKWANEVLVHEGSNRYSLSLLSGDRVGESFRADNDESAVKLAALVARGAWDKKNEGAKVVELLKSLEEANKSEMFDCLNNDELKRLQAMLFVWSDLAKLEILKRGRP